MQKHSIKENEFFPAPGGAGSINVQPGWGTFASPEVSQNSNQFAHSDQNKAVNQKDNTRNDTPDSASMSHDLNAIYAKKDTPTPDEIVTGIKYEMGQQIKKDKLKAKEVVLTNLKKDPHYYGKLKMLNIDDKSMVDNMSENVSKRKKIDPKKMEKALTYLSIVNPAGYAQLLLMPFGPVPSYAWEDPNSEWWSSEDAFSMYRSIIDAFKNGPKPGGPTKTVPGAKYSYQTTVDNMTEEKKHPNDGPLREKVTSNVDETKKIFEDMAKAKDNKYVVNSQIVDVMKEMWEQKRKRSSWKNGQ